MNITMQLAVVCAVCLCLAEAGPEVRVARAKQRPTRGFKNVEMMTARGFGKRDRPATRAERDVDHESAERAPRSTPTFKSPTVGIARDFGKRTDDEDYSYETSPRKKFNPKSSLMVASDFGKRNGADEESDDDYELRVTRDTFQPGSNVLIARGYGKRTDSQSEDYEVRETRHGHFNPGHNVLIARGYGKREEPQSKDCEIRETRGKFKPNPKVLIARDYGKRAEAQNEDYELRVTRGTFRPGKKVLIARGYGKRTDENQNGVYGLDNFWEMLEASPERDLQDGDAKSLESIPLDWFVNEMLNNPDFARSVVRKFVDLNQDGQLTSDELLRNPV